MSDKPTDAMIEAWQPRIGEQVVVCSDKEWASDWVDAAGQPLVLHVAAIAGMPGGGYDVTVTDEWPLPATKLFGQGHLTDGFIVGRPDSTDDLRPLAALTPDPAARSCPECHKPLTEHDGGGASCDNGCQMHFKEEFLPPRHCAPDPVQSDGEALKVLCIDFVREQSCGEWSEKDIQEDAAKLVKFVRSCTHLTSFSAPKNNDG